MTIQIIYHGSDFDGIGSAAICYQECLKRYPNQTIFLHPQSGGAETLETTKWNSDDTIYILDISLRPVERMKKLQQNFKNIIYCDHHTSALEANKNEGLSFEGIQDKKLAGIQCTFKHFFPTKEFPTFVNLIAWEDLWLLDKDENTFPFQYALQSEKSAYDPKSDLWKDLLVGTQSFERLLTKGQNIFSFVQQDFKKSASIIHFVDFEGHHVPAVNRGQRGSKVFFFGMPNRNDYPFTLTYYYRDGAWSINMYKDAPKKDNTDIVTIAKKYGGGGNKLAAGFRIKELPFSFNEK